jgi:hypothetical protein
VVPKLFWFTAHCKTYTNVLAYFVYRIENILIYLYLVSKENPNSHRYDVENCIKMERAKIFMAHLATSCDAPFENHWLRCTTALHLYVRGPINLILRCQNIIQIVYGLHHDCQGADILMYAPKSSPMSSPLWFIPSLNCTYYLWLKFSQASCHPQWQNPQYGWSHLLAAQGDFRRLLSGFICHNILIMQV